MCLCVQGRDAFTSSDVRQNRNPFAKGKITNVILPETNPMFPSRQWLLLQDPQQTPFILLCLIKQWKFVDPPNSLEVGAGQPRTGTSRSVAADPWGDKAKERSAMVTCVAVHPRNRMIHLARIRCRDKRHKT